MDVPGKKGHSYQLGLPKVRRFSKEAMEGGMQEHDYML